MRKRTWGWIFIVFLLISTVVIVIIGGARWDNASGEFAPAEVIGENQDEVNEDIDEEEYDGEADNVYEKIERGLDVNALIIGDSLGMSTGEDIDQQDRWTSILSENIEETFDATFDYQYISASGQTVLEAWADYHNADLEDEYDVVLVSFGQNDLDETPYADLYEAVVRDILENRGNPEIMALADSDISAEEEIAEHYNIVNVDLIESMDSNDMQSAIASEIFTTFENNLDTERELPEEVEDRIFDSEQYVEKNVVELDEVLLGNVSGSLLAVRVQMIPEGGDINVFAHGEMIEHIDTNTDEEFQYVHLVDDNFQEGAELMFYADDPSQIVEVITN